MKADESSTRFRHIFRLPILIGLFELVAGWKWAMGKWSNRFQVDERWRSARGFLTVLYGELLRTRVFTVAAAVAFYFVLSLVPLLIVFSALLGLMRLPNLFGQLLDLTAMLVPPDAMGLVQRIMTSVITPHRGGLLSFGILGSLWASSGGFSSLIEALDIAYDVKKSRPWWRDRLQALILTLTSGGLVFISLLALLAEPKVSHLLARVFPIPPEFSHVWPILRPVLTFVAFLLSIIVLYKLAPNARHSMASTLPGAVFAMVAWFGGSAGFSFYVRHFAHYNTMYGSLGAVIVLMLWFYIIALAVLIGGEMNAELAKRRQTSGATQKSNSERLAPEPTKPNPSTSDVPAA